MWSMRAPRVARAACLTGRGGGEGARERGVCVCGGGGGQTYQ